MTTRLPLVVDEYVPAVRSALDAHRAVVVTAAPGAGKTTRVAPALAEDAATTPVILLQPRRVAARAIARRIAEERGWTPGREVGWHVRFDRRFGAATRLLVATEGILTARLQDDPLLASFRTVILDEFHERSLHADLGLALARHAWLAREDLRLVVMSATLDAGRVAAFLGGCPVIDVPGRAHPLTIEYRPGTEPEEAVVEVVDRLAASSAPGAVLCFLPGVREIRRTAERLAPRLAGRDVPVQPLHGSLEADAQDAALVPTGGLRVILATNLAETTLTVPDVVAVVDTGRHKVARYDAARAIDQLETERIPQDSADQRAGRAGRVGPGTVIRLWDARDRLRPFREPDIARVDLAGPVLDILAWGGDPRTLEWFEPPKAEALEAALALVERLGAVDASGRLTSIGRDLARLPLHPRLGRILLAASGAPEAARACALLSERFTAPPRSNATTCDLLSLVEGRAERLPPHVRSVADELRRLMRSAGQAPADRIDEAAFRRAVLAGYPDRVARRRERGSDRLALASGTGARLARESGVVNAEFLVAVEVVSGQGSEAIVRLATGIDREWLPAAGVRQEIRHEVGTDGRVRAVRVDLYDALVLAGYPVPPDPAEAATRLAGEYRRRGPTERDRALAARLSVAGLDVSLDALIDAAAGGATRLDEIDLERHLPPEVRHALERAAPDSLLVPSGRRVRLDYREDGQVVAAVKLQELFGLADSPRLGRNGVPVTFELLAPNGRPVQVTRDLSSFWARAYPELRKTLGARYPRHPWPEDPWTAEPTGRPIRRRPS